MILTKKHIGGLFVNRGTDGSWCWQLIGIKGKKLLFYSFSGRYEIDTNAYADWMPFIPVNPWPSHWLEDGWKSARDSSRVVVVPTKRKRGK